MYYYILINNYIFYIYFWVSFGSIEDFMVNCKLNHLMEKQLKANQLELKEFENKPN